MPVRYRLLKAVRLTLSRVIIESAYETSGVCSNGPSPLESATRTCGGLAASHLSLVGFVAQVAAVSIRFGLLWRRRPSRDLARRFRRHGCCSSNIRRCYMSFRSEPSAATQTGEFDVEVG